MDENGQRDMRKEEEIALLWTELGFELHDLKIDKLAKRCRIKGKHWANPKNSDKEYIKKADISLERMERLANECLLEIAD